MSITMERITVVSNTNIELRVARQNAPNASIILFVLDGS